MFKRDSYEKYFLAVALLFVIIYMIRNYIGAILITFVFAFVFLPLYNRLSKRINKHVSAIICVLILISIIILPIFIVANNIYGEVSKLSIEQVSSVVENLPYSERLKEMNITPENIRDTIISGVFSIVRSGISQIPTILLNFFIIIFGMYYLILDWENISEKIKENFPLEKKKEFFGFLSKKTKGIIYGLSVVGIYDFIIAAIGFYISGVSFPLTFALLVGISAFAYLIDPFIVWVPLTIYYFAIGDTATAVGVLITGLILETDAFIRPRVVGKFADINPFAMLIGLIGGVTLFGIFGLIIGPILIISTLKIIDLVKE